MADFEARAEPFTRWHEDKRRALLGGLSDIAVKHVPFSLGTVDKGEKPGFRARYEANFAKIIKEIWIASNRTSKPVTVVFAAHEEIRAEFIERAFDFWNKDRDFTFDGFADPIQVCPLQVTDIVAYELCRAARSVRPTRRRYPLERLKERYCFCCTPRPSAWRIFSGARRRSWAYEGSRPRIGPLAVWL